MRNRLMITSAMTPTERRLGRYLRAPDGHPEAAPAVSIMVDVPDPEPAPAPAAPEPKQKTIDDLYDEEFGGVDPESPDDGDGDDGEVDEGADDAPQDPPEPKGAPSKEEYDDLRERSLRMERELEELRSAAKPKEAPQEEPVSKEAKAPDPADYEFGAADEKFIADNARWHAEQRFNELQETARVQSQLEAIETKWKGALEAENVKEQYPDFADKVTKGAAENKWGCSPTMGVLIKNSEVGPHVAYELASNAEESWRIAKLSPEEQLLEFGRLEGRALARREFAAQQQATPPKRTTGAPPPPPTRSRGAAGKFASSQDALYEQMLSDFD